MEKRQLPEAVERFIDKFQPSKFKTLAKGIEIRGVKDVHRHMEMARALIKDLKLPLEIHHSAEMVSYGGYEVKIAS